MTSMSPTSVKRCTVKRIARGFGVMTTYYSLVKMWTFPSALIVSMEPPRKPCLDDCIMLQFWKHIISLCYMHIHACYIRPTLSVWHISFYFIITTSRHIIHVWFSIFACNLHPSSYKYFNVFLFFRTKLNARHHVSRPCFQPKYDG